MHIVIALKQAGSQAGTYGPFPNEEAAHQWAKVNLPEDTWRSTPVINPYQDDEPTPEEKQPQPTPQPQLKHQIRICNPHKLTSEEREQAVSIDFLESPLACPYNLSRKNPSGHPLPRYSSDTREKYQKWLDERLAAQDPHIRNTLNALYQHLKRGNTLILTTRGAQGPYSPAFEIKRRLINAFHTPCQPCTSHSIHRTQLKPHEHVWSATQQTTITDRYGQQPHITRDFTTTYTIHKRRYRLKQHGPRGKAFFETKPKQQQPPKVAPQTAYQIHQQ